ncbi:Acyl transferase/acyl hydrolase/lysophospholipase [Artemisia annua]|uniref:Acyl transferase/acyl hydrolase/lysophospholipase n=1 Tax=Artemisia annua TaxID=35608 RepID=A0A2U1PRE9_ARTAN|nr:Acyl transferase/acyl hydrolase/lysophospholipase [Artemisia annua]
MLTGQQVIQHFLEANRVTHAILEHSKGGNVVLLYGYTLLNIMMYMVSSTCLGIIRQKGVWKRESEGAFQYSNYRREADGQQVIQHFLEANRVTHAILEHSKGGNVVLLYGYTLLNIMMYMVSSTCLGIIRQKGVWKRYVWNLSAFFSLIFRLSSCHHPLLASAMAKRTQDEGNRVAIGKDENAVRDLISMIRREDQHVVVEVCSALTSLTSDVFVALQSMKCDIMQPVKRVLTSVGPQELKSVLQVVGKLGFVSDMVAQKILSKDVMKSLKLLCAHKDPEVKRLALIVVGNLAFCPENRRILMCKEWEVGMEIGRDVKREEMEKLVGC